MVAKRYTKDLDKKKDNVKAFHQYFKPNFDRYHEFRRFIFKTSMTDDERRVNDRIGKPNLEFNQSEAYISRLRGEFAKQEPSLSVTAIDGRRANQTLIDVVEGYVRELMFSANNRGFEDSIYLDLLSGGFSVIKVWTDYRNEKAFEQDIMFGKVFDPTLCGFDINASLPNKGDGLFSFENFPKTVEEIEEEFGDINLDKLNFTRDNGGFSWSYKTQKQEEIVLVCDYYEKKRKKAKIVEVANGSTMTTDEYEEFVEKWKKSNRFEVPPTATRSRQAFITTICRTKFIEDQVIDYEETDFKYLPHIFVGGNSIMLRDGADGANQQVTRPYLYHAKDQQRLINFAGQTLANELENITQSKYIMPIEGLPDNTEYTQSLMNNQVGNIILFNAYRNKTDQKPLPPPREVQRTAIPQEVIATFMGGQQVMQSIIGSYDAALGINNNELSGIAIQEGATQSNSAAMPYINGFLQGLNQLAQIIVDLIPKYKTTPTTIPFMFSNGKRGFVPVNQEGGIQLDYDPNSLEVKIEAGVNFNIQKSRTLQQIVSLSSAMPGFGNFMNEVGLKVIIKNLEGHAMDELEDLADKYMQKIEMMQQQQMQQPNPVMLKVQHDNQKLQMEAQQNQAENQIEAAKVAQVARSNDIEAAKVMMQAHQAGSENAVQIAKAKAETYSKAVDIAIKAADLHHTHSMDSADTMHRHTIETLDMANQIANSQQPQGDMQNA